MTQWYTTVSFGTLFYEGPHIPHGPWKSLDEAQAALKRWSDRSGWLAGTYLNAHNIRIAGPYRTREEARNADISNHPVPKQIPRDITEF